MFPIGHWRSGRRSHWNRTRTFCLPLSTKLVILHHIGYQEEWLCDNCRCHGRRPPHRCRDFRPARTRGRKTVHSAQSRRTRTKNSLLFADNVHACRRKRAGKPCATGLIRASHDRRVFEIAVRVPVTRDFLRRVCGPAVSGEPLRRSGRAPRPRAASAPPSRRIFAARARASSHTRGNGRCPIAARCGPQ